MEKEKITINGMEFQAERLHPNYRGEYDCRCEECIFNKSWVDFGNEEPCRKVECIHHTKDNYNVWAPVGGIDMLKSKDEKTMHPIDRMCREFKRDASLLVPQENHFREGCFKGAEWMAQKASEWIEDHIDDYIGDDFDDDAFKFDFSRAMEIFTDDGELK